MRIFQMGPIKMIKLIRNFISISIDIVLNKSKNWYGLLGAKRITYVLSNKQLLGVRWRMENSFHLNFLVIGFACKLLGIEHGQMFRK